MKYTDITRSKGPIGVVRATAILFALVLSLGLAGCDDDTALEEAEDAAEEAGDDIEDAAEEAAEETEDAVEEVEEEIEDDG
jgi:uncharacterized lipoprotein YehR (DUF1307 family)